MQQSTRFPNTGCIETRLIKHVKLVHKGRFSINALLDVTRIEFEEDGSYTIVVEE